MDLEVFKKKGKVKETEVDHPVYWLLYREPSAKYNKFEWIETSMIHVLLWGNAYSLIRRNRIGDPKELVILPPWEVLVKMTDRGRIFYEWRHDNNQVDIISPENILHFKNLSTNGLVGLSPIAIQRENLGNTAAKNAHEGAFYRNGAKASGVLITPSHLDDKALTNLKKSWEKEYSGSDNHGKTVMLEDGVKYQQLMIPQNDAQFLESKKFDRSEIAGWFRVPLHLIQDLERATFSNISDQDRAFAKYTINPWAQRIQQELDRKLFFQDERGVYTTQFNLDDIIKGDIKTRYEVYGMAIDRGILKPSEPREAEGWPMDGTEEINKFFMNSTNMPVGELGKKTDNNNQNEVT